MNWCPKDQTVLANEQVIDGRCERCGTVVEKRDLEQWFFRITDYADRLLDDLETIDWPPHVVTMQRNWIGRSEGAKVKFHCEAAGTDYEVFTTRPDTLFGATFFVMAPEHPDVLKLSDSPEVREYVKRTLTESAEERGAEDREKTGVALGTTVTNPVNGEEIPMFVADYVLMEYGTGAIMAVPAHDERDFEFAQKHGLEIRRVVEGGDELPYPGDGPMVNSGRFDGVHNREAFDQIVEEAKRRAGGQLPPARLAALAPALLGLPDPDRALPRLRARARARRPAAGGAARRWRTTRPRAARRWPRPSDWVNTTCPKCGGDAKRETDTMDTFVDSSWYFLRYCDAHNDEAPWDREVREALDARRSVHRRRGARDPAPDVRPLLRQGAGGHGAARRAGALRPPVHPGHGHARGREDVQVEGQRGLARVRSWSATARTPRAATSSTSATPPRGATGPTTASRACSASCRGCGARPTRRPTGRPSREGEPGALVRKAHWAIDKVTRDMGDRFATHTAIAAVIELVNEIYKERESADPSHVRFAIATAASLVFPFAPHLGSEVYEPMTGRRVWEEPWPQADADLLSSDVVQLVVQLNGKLIDRLEMPADASEEVQEQIARGSEKLAGRLDGKEIVKTIVVPHKLVNFVAR